MGAVGPHRQRGRRYFGAGAYLPVSCGVVGGSSFLLLALEARLARPGALEVVAHVEAQPAQALGLELDLVAVLERVQAAMVGAGGEDVAGLQRVDRR